jgi:hypothetical protein
MTRPNIEAVPVFYQPYVELVKEMELIEALMVAGKQVQELLMTIPEAKGSHRYGVDKWTVKEVLNHMMDAERVFAYRALRFARKDQTPLESFDENQYAIQANANGRTIYRLAKEMQWLRETTIDLYESFNHEMLLCEGTASGKRISVLNLGYIIAGHDLHHRKILTERYLNS